MKTSWFSLNQLRAYGQPRALLMLALGFSSGLPFLLTGNTFGYWLRDEGTTLTAIGFLSWVGIAYSLKFLWAPLVDRLPAPIFGRLGQRRGWMALSQIMIGLGLVGMALIGTHHGLIAAAIFALIVAFASATQDIVIDAWRIEIAAGEEELGILSAAYQFGYRIALLATEALILIIAAGFGWAFSYIIFGILMGVGLAATLLASEPARAEAVVLRKAMDAPLWKLRGFFDAVIGPFIAFFRTHGWLAIAILLAISLYRLPDFLMGPMTNPFYHDIGLSKGEVGTIRGSVGLIASFVGIALGGFSVLRFGLMPSLIAGGILQVIATLGFALMAQPDLDIRIFAAVMATDNFANSFSGVALISYMSSLTSLGYTATQYALLTSSYAWIGKVGKGFSGVVVEGLSTGHGLIAAYGLFFVGIAAIGLPAIFLFLWLQQHLKKKSALSAKTVPAHPAPDG